MKLLKEKFNALFLFTKKIYYFILLFKIIYIYIYIYMKIKILFEKFYNVIKA